MDGDTQKRLTELGQLARVLREQLELSRRRYDEVLSTATEDELDRSADYIDTLEVRIASITELIDTLLDEV